MRASDEHILIVRVPRAQKIIRPHPLLCLSILTGRLFKKTVQQDRSR